MPFIVVAFGLYAQLNTSQQFFVCVGVGVILLLVAIVVCHLLIPGWGWLEDEEWEILVGVYSGGSKFIAPLALMGNAWAVAYYQLAMVARESHTMS